MYEAHLQGQELLSQPRVERGSGNVHDTRRRLGLDVRGEARVYRGRVWIRCGPVQICGAVSGRECQIGDNLIAD